jgi:hypothetical protein
MVFSLDTLKAGGVIVTPSPALLLYIIVRTCPSVICLDQVQTYPSQDATPCAIPTGETKVPAISSTQEPALMQTIQCVTIAARIAINVTTHAKAEALLFTCDFLIMLYFLG